MGYLEVVKILLKYGADIYQGTPLVCAAKRNGHAPICKALITESFTFPKLGNIGQARNVIRKLRLSLKRVAPYLNRDIFFQILASSKELRTYVTRLALFLYKQNRPFPSHFLQVVQEGLTDLRIEEMNPLLLKSFLATDNNEEVKSIVKRDGFEEQFRNDIHKMSLQFLKDCRTQNGKRVHSQTLLTTTKKLILGSVLAGTACVLYWLLSKDKNNNTSVTTSSVLDILKTPTHDSSSE